MRLRSYILGDEEGILELRRDVFGSKDPFKLNRDAWEWEFLQNPEGESIIIVAEEKAKIVGHYGLLPLIMSYYGKNVALALAVDLMVHPSFRRKGLFLRLFEHIVEEAKRHNIDAILGFPNRITLPTYINKLGWHHVKSVKTHVKISLKNLITKSHTIMFTTNRSNFSLHDKSYMEFVRISNFNDIPRFDNIASSQFIFINRSPSYLNWRYIQPHWYQYIPYAILIESEIKGFFVLRFMSYKGFQVAVLIDIFPMSLALPPIFSSLIQSISSMCFFAGAGVFVFPDPIHGGSPFYGVSVQIPEHLSPRPWYVGWKDISSMGVPQGKDFYITFGDGDII
jgi:GNAT superfamily N-acetyltransferase